MVATATGQSLMTAEEFYAWAELPENEDKLFELENGVPVEMPNANNLHGTICWLVSWMLGQYLVPRGGYVMTNDTGLDIRRRPDTVRGPDVMAFLTRPRFEDLKRGPVEDVPALVAEVLSPSDRPGKTHRRVQGYLRRGIPMVWVIDPQDRTVAVHTATEFHVLEEAEELTGNGVLPDFRCPVAAFFNWPGEA